MFERIHELDFVVENFEPNSISLAGFYMGYAMGSIPRYKMPQTDLEQMSELHALLDMNPTDKRAAVTELKPSQFDTPQEKCNDMINNHELWNDKLRDLPIYVSTDQYILDGHTRCMAAQILNDTLPIRVIPLPGYIALAMMNLYNRLMIAKGRQEPINQA